MANAPQTAKTPKQRQDSLLLGISPAPELRQRALRERFYSAGLLNTDPAGRKVAWWVAGIFGLVILSLFLPWQQNIQGTGYVTAFNPQDRPQDAVSTIAGQIEEWYVQEGQYVSKGTPIARIVEIKDKYFDPNLNVRLGEQVAAKQLEITSKQAKIDAYTEQIRVLRQGLELKLAQTVYKVQIDSADLEAAKVNLAIAQRQLEGQQALYDKGLKSLVDLENRRGKLQEAQAKVVSAQNKLTNSRIELGAVRAEYNKEIAKADAERSATLAELSESRGSLAKLQNERTNVEVRQGFYIIRAPQDGYVVKALKQGLGEQVKEQDPIVTIMPSDPKLAVELYITGTDVPLVHRGDHVRLQFDGWPALQFSGWPAIAVGTFGGKVQVVDYVASNNGKYRVLVIPDTVTANDPAWPDARLLRQGSGVYGWAMLNEVPVWYELWRQLNGFPPNLTEQPDPDAGKKGKDAKATSKAGDDE